MASFDLTPIAVAIISASGAVLAAYYAYNSGKKTKNRIDTLPNDLVDGFAKLQPGVDTVEKVVELLYTEIGRLTDENTKLRARIDKLVEEKQALLDEIRKMKSTLEEQRKKLTTLENRIKRSIGE